VPWPTGKKRSRLQRADNSDEEEGSAAGDEAAAEDQEVSGRRGRWDVANESRCLGTLYVKWGARSPPRAHQMSRGVPRAHYCRRPCAGCAFLPCVLLRALMSRDVERYRD
jgi:hypothetical protein